LYFNSLCFPSPYHPSLTAASLKTVFKALGAAFGAAAAAATTKFLFEKRRSAAAIELANILSNLDSPTSLTRDMVTALETKYGAPLYVCCPQDIKTVYGLFVEAAVPPGDEPMTGDEPVLIQNFKAALELPDIEAAPAHIEVGRRVLRGRLEAGSRSEDVAARKAFQKLVYISNLVFGDRQAAFLLPWQRVFGLSNAQLQIARRDNAKALFNSKLHSMTGGQGLAAADKNLLVQLKALQQEVRLADDEATEVMQEVARTKVEQLFTTAIDCIKRRTRVIDHSEAVTAVKAAVDLNKGLKALANDADVVAGVGPTSVAGSVWESAEGRNRDLRDLFKSYLEAQVNAANAFDTSLEADAAELRSMMGLGIKEAASLETEVKEKAYRKLLREEFTSGRLDAAASKAEVLGELLEKVSWDADAAMELHQTLYKQKLTSLLDEKKSLSDNDVDELSRLQRLLCVPNDVRDAMHAELCGAIFRDAVSQALAAGVETFGFEDRKKVKAAYQAVRLDRPSARTILSDASRKYLLQYVTKSRIQRSRVDAAKELKKMVMFSNIVLAPLLDDLKTDEDRKKEAEETEQQAKIQEMIAKAREEAEKKEKEGKEAEAAGSGTVKSEEEKEKEDKDQAEALLDALENVAATDGEEKKEEEELVWVGETKAKEKTQTAATVASSATEEREKGEGETSSSSSTTKTPPPKPIGQKEITLATDLDQRDRLDIYKNFLMYCMTGDVVQGPMGVTMVTERDDTEFARLSQLGDILGLTQMDVYGVHQDLAETAFKQQVQSAMSDGMLTPDRAASLEGLREKMGLPKEAAEKIIKGFQNQRVIESMQAAKAQGTLTLDRVLELKDSGIDVSSLLGEDARQQLYRQEALTRLTDGTGNFDAQRLLETLPTDLAIDVTKAKKTVTDMAKERRRTTLVQAVSYLRQKNISETVKSLNNLSAMGMAAPDLPAEKWDQHEEVADLFSVYASKEKEGEKRAAIAKVLGITEGEAATLGEIVDDGRFKLTQEAESEQEAFF
jgi:hypothetical protein